jgi:uncharacterized HhH-GPD family protein
VLGYVRLALNVAGYDTRIAPSVAPEVIDELVTTTTATRQSNVVTAILAYGSTLDPAIQSATGTPNFTANEQANRLLMTDPFAFLVSVIFDQGIVAERAWEAPFELKQRLGHLDPARIATETDAVQTAIATPPMLHRFIQNVPRWTSQAATIVVHSYGGHAERIWSDNPTARELMGRLDAFPGIGQKKAAMAVEILARDLHILIRDMHGSDIAYDVHVRRGNYSRRCPGLGGRARRDPDESCETGQAT